MKRLLFVLFAALLVAWGFPASAQVLPGMGVQVDIKVYVSNVNDGSAIPDVSVFYEELTGGCYKADRNARFTASEPTNSEGIAEFRFVTCKGPSAVHVLYASDFRSGMREFEIVPGRSSYLVALPLEPKRSAKQITRTLHVQVRGRLANGSLVPVHFAGVYDRQGRHIITTDYNGDANVQVLEAMGETVTLHADGSHWREGSGSFIVGASEGTRITRNDDYVRIVLNGEGDNLTEEATLNFLVHGKTAKGWTAVHFATIYDESGHHLVTTDYAGRATARVKAKLGEPYIVKVDGGRRWKGASKEILIGAAAGAGSTLAYNHVDFLLDPAQAAKELTVEVLNRDTDKPVPAATVTIYKPDRFPGTAVAHATTNSQGLATFDAEEVGSALLNGEARVGATHGGSKSAVQTLTGSLLQGESPKYVLYLNEKQENTKWSGTWYNGPYTMQVSGGSGSLGYQFLRSQGEGTCCPLIDRGSGSCTVHGNVATCTESAHYHDSGKDVERSSEVKLTLSGASISVTTKIKTASITLSSGQPCPDIAQCTALHPGAEFSASWTRTKP